MKQYQLEGRCGESRLICQNAESKQEIHSIIFVPSLTNTY